MGEDEHAQEPPGKSTMMYFVVAQRGRGQEKSFF